MTKISTEYGYFFHISSLTFREKGLEYYQRLRITGGKNMDSIVKKLSEIESAAAAIVRHAEEQKEVLDHEFREKRNQFDEELEKTTSSLLDEQSGENNDSIALLKQQYEINHTKYAKDILKRMTEV